MCKKFVPYIHNLFCRVMSAMETVFGICLATQKAFCYLSEPKTLIPFFIIINF